MRSSRKTGDDYRMVSRWRMTKYAEIRFLAWKKDNWGMTWKTFFMLRVTWKGKQMVRTPSSARWQI